MSCFGLEKVLQLSENNVDRINTDFQLLLFAVLLLYPFYLLTYPMAVKDLDSSYAVTFVGTLPPPLNGMSAMTEIVVNALKKQGPVTCLSWSRSKPISGLTWKLVRAWGVFKACFGLIRRGRKKGETLYYPVNSGGGLFYDILIVSLARAFGYRTALHHHVYSYIDQYDWRMAIINRLVGAYGAHAVHCEIMQADFCRQYKTDAKFLFVPPTIVSLKPSLALADPLKSYSSDRPFVLGFMSNLTISKGLQVAIDTYENLAKRGENVRLVLAGPCLEEEADQLVARTLRAWPNKVEYRGPVYNDEKAQFFADIDAFLFPTLYKNESWGIVLTEALASACPVIAYDRGCVAYIIRNQCGLRISRDEDFIAPATRQIEKWLTDPGSHQQASRQALDQAHQLDQKATEQLPRFIEQLRSLS